ncbi:MULTISPECIES: hypothetical protein [Pacificibacter]|uniref:hypothetical protein n=1 Tax=Pacificibacter TaxID=1042323 RepID=UPI001C0964B8|nr:MULTISPECIES: hypothetical protein [Pacificibacter]MBU2935509.1 hypothetical protein [Pacificibacter marinus]MDO6614006.1 hypothetical protein [Pacificibacter sp. 1_MG-2023]
MALFSKDYHPLDSRHPKNRKGAQAGTYGVQTVTSKVRATPVSSTQADEKQIHPASTKPQKFQRKLSQVEQMNALVAETQARARQHKRQPQTASPFSSSTASSHKGEAMTVHKVVPSTPKQRSKISKGFQILSNIDRNIRIGMLIAVVVYILTNPAMLFDLTSLATSGSLTGGMNTMPNVRSNF